MEQLFSEWFDQRFMPHGHCYFWRPSILWLHVVSDFLIFAAYYSIPVAIIYLVIKRKDLPYHWVFWLFGAFILLCGSTHLMSIFTIWHPEYAWEGILKAMTALVSMGTAVVLWPMIPKILQLPSPMQLKDSHDKLDALVLHLDSEVQRKTQEISERNKELETINRIRDTRENRILELKRIVNQLSRELNRPPPFNLESDGD